MSAFLDYLLRAGAASLALVCVGCVSVAPVAPQHLPAQAADQLLQDVLTVDGGVGISAAVVRGGQVVWSGAAGMSDLESGAVMARNSRMRVGSVSKSLTGALALRMAQAGVVDLDASVRQYLPQLPLSFDPITLDMLANHVAGVRHFDFANFDEANNTKYYERLVDAVLVHASSLVVAPAGESFEYSSHGYNILGAALEAAADAPFGVLVERYLAGPASLSDTLIDHPFKLIERRAEFYTLTAANPFFLWMEDNETINTIYRDSSDYYPSGGMLSSASDLAVFAHALFAGGLMNDEIGKRLRAPVARADSEAVDYAYGWELRRDKDGAILAYTHNGETNGAYALVRYFPESDLAVAGAVNYNTLRSEPAFFDYIGDRLPALFKD